jgi:hypothetical protein
MSNSLFIKIEKPEVLIYNDPSITDKIDELFVFEEMENEYGPSVILVWSGYVILNYDEEEDFYYIKDYEIEDIALYDNHGVFKDFLDSGNYDKAVDMIKEFFYDEFAINFEYREIE